MQTGKSKTSSKLQKFTPRSSSGFSREDDNAGSNKKKNKKKEKESEIEENYSENYDDESEKGKLVESQKVKKSFENKDQPKIPENIKKSKESSHEIEEDIEDNYEFNF